MFPSKIYNIIPKNLIQTSRTRHQKYSNLVPSSPNRILEKDIKMITLNAYMLAGRKYTPVQYQLQCIGGSAIKDLNKYPTQVKCINNGLDDKGKVNWIISTYLDPTVKFGEHYITFEGYDKPNDKYVYSESGILYYNLEYINSKNYDDIYRAAFTAFLIIRNIHK
jgi:hypothetical protein